MPPQVSLPSLQGGSPCKAIARRRRARLHAVLLATSALASVALAAAANAADATWSGATNDYNAAANWNAGAGPAPGAGDTATFTAAGVTKDVVFSEFTTTLGGISMTAGAGDYIFTSDAKIVIFDGTGISVGNGASLTLNVNDGGDTFFQGNSTAGQAQINING